MGWAAFRIRMRRPNLRPVMLSFLGQPALEEDENRNLLGGQSLHVAQLGSSFLAQ
jgi:hypothetical protein